MIANCVLLFGFPKLCQCGQCAQGTFCARLARQQPVPLPLQLGALPSCAAGTGTGGGKPPWGTLLLCRVVPALPACGICSEGQAGQPCSAHWFTVGGASTAPLPAVQDPGRRFRAALSPPARPVLPRCLSPPSCLPLPALCLAGAVQ